MIDSFYVFIGLNVIAMSILALYVHYYPENKEEQKHHKNLERNLYGNR